MKGWRGPTAWGIVLLTVGLLLFGAWGIVSTISQPRSTVTIGRTAVRVTVVKTQAAQQKGLGGVTDLPEGQGMLFVFAKDGPQGMWMKDMRIDLDIIWLDDTKHVTHIEHDLTPDTYPATYISPTPARYVLEVPAGTAEDDGIKIGTAATFNVN